MAAISTEIDGLKLSSSGVVNPKGFNGHYRISSSDLRTEAGRAKIRQRVQELILIQDTFGKCPVSEVIIADCESLEDMKTLSGILRDADFHDVHVVPLIESELPDDVLH
jgi:hypothetical protein